MSSRFADNFNAKVKRQRTEKSSGNGQVQDGMTGDDHASLMRRESYQDIFKTLAQSQQPSVHGPDALAAAAVVAAMAENISSASATMPSVRSPLGVAAGRGGAQQPMYTTANANHGGHPPVMMGGMSGPNAMSAAMNQMVQAAAMVQAGASGASAAVAYSGSRASGGAGGKKRHPGPIMQPTSMPPQLQMQMQAVIQQQAQQAQQQHHQHQQQRYMSSPSMSPLHGAAAGMAAPGGPVGDTTKKVNRLWKNRLAAKECRRKKKEYVKDLEDKVRDLEQKNEELMKQLRTARSSLTPVEREVLKNGVASASKPSAPTPSGNGSTGPPNNGATPQACTAGHAGGNGGTAGPARSGITAGVPGVSATPGVSSARTIGASASVGAAPTNGNTPHVTVVESAVPPSAAGLPGVTSVSEAKPVVARTTPQPAVVVPAEAK